MSLDFQTFNPEGVAPPPGSAVGRPGFSRVVTVQGDMRFVYIAGQTPSDMEYKPVAPGDYQAQYVSVMESLRVQLEAAGATWDDVVFRRIFALDVDAYVEAIRRPDTPTYFSLERPPPSTMIGVTRLSNPEFLIEIDLFAVTAPKQ